MLMVRQIGARAFLPVTDIVRPAVPGEVAKDWRMEETAYRRAISTRYGALRTL
jgi:hypothetical protein